MLPFESDWRDWLDQWDANEAEVESRYKGFLSRKQPNNTGRATFPKSIVAAAAALLLFTLLIALGIGLGVSLHSNNEPAVEAQPTPTPTPIVKQWCTPQPAYPYTSNTAGDPTTPEGLLATMEQQYFGLRSAADVLALTYGPWAGIESVASTIQSLPLGPIEWCTKIRPAEPGWYTVVVDWHPTEDPENGHTWVADYHIENIPAMGLRITGFRPNLKVVEELRQKQEAEKAATKAVEDSKKNNGSPHPGTSALPTAHLPRD